MLRILRAVFFGFLWFWIALAFFVFGYSVVRAGHPDEQKIRAALDNNFEAYNREDVKGMMATLSPTLPRRNEFKAESTVFFRDNDAYISVLDFELLEVRGQFAVARVVQGTSLRDGAPEPTEEQAFYRDHSKLLPEEERTEYLQAFKRENGKWRLWLLLSPPKQASTSHIIDNGVNVRNDCPNGNCGFPRVRVTAR